jgi:hypothetical protein
MQCLSVGMGKAAIGIGMHVMSLVTVGKQFFDIGQRKACDGHSNYRHSHSDAGKKLLGIATTGKAVISLLSHNGIGKQVLSIVVW